MTTLQMLMVWRQGNPRTTSLLAVAKANNIKLDLVHTEPAKGVSTDYLKLNRLGKVPTFEGSDGYVLSECIAIAIYRECISYPSLSPASACIYDEPSTFNYSYPCLKTTVEIRIHTLNYLTSKTLPYTTSVMEIWNYRAMANPFLTVTSQNEKTTLLGKTKQDYASILRWMSFANSELLPSSVAGSALSSAATRTTRRTSMTSMKAVAAKVKVMEDHLTINTYLVGERLTLADIFCTLHHLPWLRLRLRQAVEGVSTRRQSVVRRPLYNQADLQGRCWRHQVDRQGYPQPAPEEGESKPKEQPKKQEKPKAAAA